MPLAAGKKCLIDVLVTTYYSQFSQVSIFTVLLPLFQSMRGKVKKASWPDYVKSHTTQSFLDTLNIIQVVKSCSKYKKFILFFSQLTFGLKGESSMYLQLTYLLLQTIYVSRSSVPFDIFSDLLQIFIQMFSTIQALQVVVFNFLFATKSINLRPILLLSLLSLQVPNE